MATIHVAMALTFALFGLVILLLVLRVVIEALVGDPRSFPDRWKLRRKERLLLLADECASAPSPERCFELLRGAFFLDHTSLGAPFIDKIYNHHLAILGRLVTLAEQRNKHLANLPVVEDLLQTRVALLKTFVDKLATKSSVARRRRQKGQETPGWAMQEYSRAIQQLKDQIATNRQALDSQLDKLFESLHKIAEGDEVTYH